MRQNYLTFRNKINVRLLETQLTASGEVRPACGESIPRYFCRFLKHSDSGFPLATYEIKKFSQRLAGKQRTLRGAEVVVSD